MTMDLTPDAMRALHLLENTQSHLFITGKAGTGKSTLLSHFCTHTTRQPVVLAPTGVAALHIKGQTIHRFFNFYVDVTPAKIAQKQVKPRDPKLYRNLTCVIIDEVSMVRADLLDCVDAFLRLYGPKPGMVFGGVQMVFVGDLYQLPPVVGREEQDIFHTHYATPYFFSAHAMEALPLEVVELTHVYRQKDPMFLDVLHRMRQNTLSHADIAHINTRVGAAFDTVSHDDPTLGHTGAGSDFAIHLTTTNKQADILNETHLRALKTPLYSVQARITGDFGKEYFPSLPELQFKSGAQIMLLNNDPKKRWVNGSIGVVESIKTNPEGEEYVRVRLHEKDKIVAVAPFTWDLYRFALDTEGGAIVSQSVGTFTQYPFRLAWAVTIHKSQGKTFDRVCIDIGNGSFATGQMYVAFSRCTSFEGISLKAPIRPRDVRIDPEIAAFLERFRLDAA
jgi:ATP-dependent DNA helicase PIF1